MTPAGNAPLKIAVLGASDITDVPGLADYASRFDISCAPDGAALSQVLPQSEVLLGWNFRGTELSDYWHLAKNLKWIHWGGAGVDAVLFPNLQASDVILTNSRGLFDRAMAEYILGYMLSEVKLFPATRQLQAERKWQHRYSSRLAGQSAAIYGVGSIGREIARLLRAVGVSVCGIGRTARNGDPDFGEIHGATDQLNPLSHADWAIGILPGTPATTDYFNAEFFNAMKPSARFVNLGRGTAVVEPDIFDALSFRRHRRCHARCVSHRTLAGGQPHVDSPQSIHLTAFVRRLCRVSR